jgi:carbamoyltransferase
MTSRLGLKPQEDEYILMGMAAYGDPHRKHKGKELIQHIYDTFGIRHENGLATYTMQSSNVIHFAENLHRGCRWFLPELTTEQDHFDLAAATQHVYELILRELLWKAKQHYFSENVVLMGGCALNCSANSLIKDYYKNIWIMPNPGDSGSCIGVTQKYMKQRIEWKTPYLGHDIPGEYPTEVVLNNLIKYPDSVFGIASGRAEFGPRALGNRTLTADPRGNAIKDKVNEIKKRQKFRPFAPMILEEDVNEYFDGPTGPYMQFVAKCKHPNEFPAIVHKDGTSRVQTVNKQQHPDLHDLLTRFKDKTGCPMLLNTSLNIKGMPIVNDEQDAFNFSKYYQTLVFTSLK